jgi:phospho-N-acetylmuramoyl-pentapeptide-transferase
VNKLVLTILTTSLVSLLTSLAVSGLIIKLMKDQGLGQQIRNWGPTLHEHKSGTPTMGGLAILAGIGVSTFLLWFFFPGAGRYLPLFLLGAFGFGLIGFSDDLLSILREQSKGLNPVEKIVSQLVLSLLLILLAFFLLDGPNRILLPYIGKEVLLTPFWYYPLMVFVLVGTVNAVNISDGLDGLASGGTVITLTTFALLGPADLLPILLISVAATVGFLWHNLFPAELFLGDTGSFALGGIIATAAIVTRGELFLPLLGGIFVLDTLSVIIQVSYYKITGGRVFKISPLHHHFESAEGIEYSYLLPRVEWAEPKVTGRLWIVHLILGSIGLAGYFCCF